MDKIPGAPRETRKIIKTKKKENADEGGKPPANDLG